MALLEKPKPITLYSTREEQTGKRPIGRQRMRWEDVIEELGGVGG